MIISSAVDAIAESVLTTRGDMIQRSASAAVRLALGAENKVLYSDGTDAAWGSPSLLNSKVLTAQRDSSDAAGDVSYTGSGFTPSALVCFAGCNDGTLDSSASWGVCSSDLTEYCISRYTNSDYVYTSNLLQGEVGTGNSSRATVKSWDADGFTLAYTKAGTPSGTLDLVFLCLG